MVSLRQATMEDLFNVQLCNVINLPENYRMNYYFYHLLSWPQLTQVAEDENGNIVGYVLAKIDTESDNSHGHITSVAVMREYRMLGLASKLMKLTHRAIQETHSVPSVSLHVRVTNKAAYNLYSNVLGYSIKDIEQSYYADGEDAFNMWHIFEKEPITIDSSSRNAPTNLLGSFTPSNEINPKYIPEFNIDGKELNNSTALPTESKSNKKQRKKKKK